MAAPAPVAAGLDDTSEMLGLHLPVSREEQQRNMLASAAVFAPLAAHRLLEYLSLKWAVPTWSSVALHLLPPLAMLAVAILLWRVVAPLPGKGPAVSGPGQRGLCIAAGMLLGVLAALANLLSMLAVDGEATAGAMKVDPAAAALVLHVMVLAPIAEEVAFRGIVFRHLRQFMVPGAAVVSSAVIFAVMHANLSQAIWAFVLGLVAGLAYEATRSVITPILVHALFNAVPVGVAVARANPTDLGPIWLVVGVIAMVFTFAARSAGRATPYPR